ncbi:MAG: flagellar biosynthesis protein FlhB [Bacteriovoracaceae bacterium]|jgi:flagellar biosynthetic protein FlhB|nr:flagellar biosynthesis protein FlhB [Bacteriovoracaceae bacterium]
MADDQGEKTEEPSQHRIDEARKKGDVASSKEVSSVLVLTGTFCVLVLSSLYIFEIFSEYIEWLYTLDFKKAYTQELGKRVLTQTVVTLGKAIAPVFITSATLGIIAQIMQIGILYSPEVLQLKFERLNPLSGLKRIFSKKAIAEVIKGIFKFSVVLSITYFIIDDNMNSFTGFLHTESAEAFNYGKMLAFKLALSILLGLAIVAAMDFAWEKYSYKEKLRMTKQQVKEEQKEQDGNPEVKQKIRAIQRDMATKRMINDIKTADVIVTNPTHISIAIKYDGQTMVAPAVVGKGSEHLALRIREIAKEHEIPIVENVPLARALYKTVKVGHGVPRSLYKVVAEILAFVYKMKKRKKAIS